MSKKMKKIVGVIAFCLSTLPMYAQTKEEALSEFDWLTGYVQRNYPGYEVKTKGHEKEWNEYMLTQREVVASQPDTLPIILNEYLQRFKDGHLWFQLSNKGFETFQGIMQRERARYMQQQKEKQPQSINMYFTAKAMNDSTFFLRIPSFADDTSNKLVDENWEAITSRPYLIIDLRANGGGNDENFQSLMSLVYSQPYLTHGVELYATPDFLEMYKKIIAEEPDAESSNYYKSIVTAIEKNLSGYVLRPGMKRLNLRKRDTVYPNPKRVGILIHGRNASSAEQFILEARESEKVTLFGNENTRGVIDLSNVYNIESPRQWFKLYIPTTRSCRWPDIIIDGKGIAPQIPIPHKESLQERDNIGEEIRYIERVLRGI